MQPSIMHISKQSARRFVLGKQGLWPGRRWQGKNGVGQAIRECEAVQLDPLNIGARSQDIFLHSRVFDYRPEYLYQVMYDDRKFFDYGGSLFVYPIEEMPYWRLHMDRRKQNPQWQAMRHITPEVLDFVRSELRLRGPLGNRDFKGPRTLTSYRGGKETALALYYLWLSGEVMVHHRVGFDRVYDFRRNILPPELDYTVLEEDCESYFGRKTISWVGLARIVGWKNSINDYLRINLTLQEAQKRLEHRVESGEYMKVRVEGDKYLRYALSSDFALLETVESGNVPDAWIPLDTTTAQEAVILAPLDIVSARGRSATLFDFEYTWEVYKPVHLRRWGYYNVPVLYGDRLVAKIEPRLDRSTGILHILGFWLDDQILATDPSFASAFGRGLKRLAAMMKANDIDLSVIEPAEFRIAISREL